MHKKSVRFEKALTNIPEGEEDPAFALNVRVGKMTLALAEVMGLVPPPERDVWQDRQDIAEFGHAVLRNMKADPDVCHVFVEDTPSTAARLASNNDGPGSSTAANHATRTSDSCGKFAPHLADCLCSQQHLVDGMVQHALQQHGIEATVHTELNAELQHLRECLSNLNEMRVLSGRIERVQSDLDGIRQRLLE